MLNVECQINSSFQFKFIIMKFLDTKYKRKSAVITALLMVLVILLLFVFGLDYKDPPDEYGVEVNFGYTDKGMGDNTTSTEQVKTEPEQQQQEEQKEQQEETPEEVKPQETTSEEEVLTQDNEEAPEVNNKPVKETNPTTETTKEPVKEVKKPVVEKPKPKKPDQSTTDALNNVLNGASNNGTSNNGDGDSNQQGNQGHIDGNPYANAYYGGGSGNGSGYGLNGRKKLGVKKFPQDCNEEGKVVVKIFVNRSGKVIRTQIQQSDDPCLNAAAKKTAMSYKFDSAPNAPATQTGFVVVNFSLGE